MQRTWWSGREEVYNPLFMRAPKFPPVFWAPSLRKAKLYNYPMSLQRYLETVDTMAGLRMSPKLQVASALQEQK